MRRSAAVIARRAITARCLGFCMRYKVLKKQTISHNCFICGEKNVAGMKMAFYELENRDTVGVFTGGLEHVSYPDRMHGGIITAVLDETIGRAIQIDYPDILGVTLDIKVKFRKSVPVLQRLLCVGRITKDLGKFFGGCGEIINDKGEILASAEASYMKIDPYSTNLNLLSGKDELYESKISEDIEFFDIDIKR
jgi:acyl-coenzyme A thioesterase PaaI-like protein